MPKSKKEKIVSLTKTKAKGKERKISIVEKIREAVDKYERVFVLSAKNLQNALMKEMRDDWIHSRLFFAKNTLMAYALGTSRDTEYKRNLHKVSFRLRGCTGLLCTDSTEEEVIKWFSEFKRETFASAGDIATESVRLEAGELKMFQHTMEPHLRSLGLPTELDLGVIKLLKDFQVCKKGEELTTKEAKILKLLNRKLFNFEVTVECVWSKEKYKAFTVAEETVPAKYQPKTKKTKNVNDDANEDDDEEEEDEDEMLVEEDDDDEEEDDDE